MYACSDIASVRVREVTWQYRGNMLPTAVRVRFEKYEAPLEKKATHIGALQRKREGGHETLVIALDPGSVSEDLIAKLLAIAALSAQGTALGPPAPSEVVGLLANGNLVGGDNTPVVAPARLEEGVKTLCRWNSPALQQILGVYRDKDPRYETELRLPEWTLVQVRSPKLGGR